MQLVTEGVLIELHLMPPVFGAQIAVNKTDKTVAFMVLVEEIEVLLSSQC